MNTFNPKEYPVCSECNIPWVVRLAIVLVDGKWRDEWVFQRDCKHKETPPRISTAKKPRKRKATV